MATQEVMHEADELTQTLVNVRPEELLVVKNIRFGLIPDRVDALAEQIRQLGYVHTNLKIFPLENPGPKGEQYGIREGHYRHAAVKKLNSGKKGLDLTLPCQLEEQTDDLTRIDCQLSENIDRNELSPMDKAIVIDQYLQAGLQKVQIRQKFLRPGKGKEQVPLSNAMLNIYLDFLKFPKAIQDKIHTGALGVKEAYKLTTKSPDLWEPILAQAEKDRLDDMSYEEKLEDKYLADSKKFEEQEAKEKAAKEALEAAKRIADEAEQVAAAKLEASNNAYLESQKVPTKNKEAKAKALEAWKAKEAETKAAQKEAEEKKAAADKLIAKAQKSEQEAQARRDKLEQARKEAMAKVQNGSGGKLNIDKASAKVEGGGGPVALNAVEMRRVISDWGLPGSFPKVRLIAMSIARCFSGEITDNQCLSEMAFHTGERKDRPKTLPKEAK